MPVDNPDFDTPAPIAQPAIGSLLTGSIRYADVRGKRVPRQRTAECHQQCSGQAVGAGQVVVLAGAQCALYVVMQCLLNPGDEMIVVELMYATYETAFDACGARMAPAPVYPENGFCAQAGEVTALITPRTCAMALNNPHNPSGTSLPRATQEVPAELCTAHDLWMISGKVYNELSLNGERVGPASLPGTVKRTATLNNPSKFHVMTGWRTGWVVGPTTFCVHLENLTLCMFYGSPEFIQDVICTAPEVPPPGLETVHEAYRRRCDLVIECLADSLGLHPLRPDGDMFVTVDIHPIGLSVRIFADHLPDRHGVSVLVGEAFGLSVAGCIHLGLTLGVEPLREVCRRIVLCAAESLDQV